MAPSIWQIDHLQASIQHVSCCCSSWPSHRPTGQPGPVFGRIMSTWHPRARAQGVPGHSRGSSAACQRTRPWLGLAQPWSWNRACRVPDRAARAHARCQHRPVAARVPRVRDSAQNAGQPAQGPQEASDSAGGRAPGTGDVWEPPRALKKGRIRLSGTLPSARKRSQAPQQIALCRWGGLWACLAQGLSCSALACLLCVFPRPARHQR